MKKSLTVLGIILLALTVLTTVANAATTEELISFLSQAHEIAGETKQITIKYYNKYSLTKNIKNIVFNKIILNYNENEARQTTRVQIEL